MTKESDRVSEWTNAIQNIWSGAFNVKNTTDVIALSVSEQARAGGGGRRERKTATIKTYKWIAYCIISFISVSFAFGALGFSMRVHMAFYARFSSNTWAHSRSHSRSARLSLFARALYLLWSIITSLREWTHQRKMLKKKTRGESTTGENLNKSLCAVAHLYWSVLCALCTAPINFHIMRSCTPLGNGFPLVSEPL